jgi:hypothetical protein
MGIWAKVYCSCGERNISDATGMMKPAHYSMNPTTIQSNQSIKNTLFSTLHQKSKLPMAKYDRGSEN